MKKKLSLARIISSIGILILCAGLICNAFELINVFIFRITTLIGIIIQIIALIVAFKRKEFWKNYNFSNRRCIKC